MSRKIAADGAAKVSKKTIGRKGMRPASRIGRFALAATIAAAGIAAATPTASASFHLTKIKEITGSAGGDNSFIELQMYEAGQNLVAGHNITVWDQDALILGSPTPVATLPLTGPNPANGQSQRTILIGDTGVAGRDFTLELTPYFDTGASNNLGPAGAACFESIPVDCVSWGAFTGAANLPDKTTPIGTVLGAGAVSFRRNIGGGSCASALDAADDTNAAAVDFTNVAASPTPNSATPTETPCTSPQSKPNPKKKKKCKKKKKKGKSAAAAKKCKKKKKK